MIKKISAASLFYLIIILISISCNSEGEPKYTSNRDLQLKDKIFKSIDRVDMTIAQLKDSINYSKNINIDFAKKITTQLENIQEDLKIELNNIDSVDKNNLDELNQRIIASSDSVNKLVEKLNTHFKIKK